MRADFDVLRLESPRPRGPFEFSRNVVTIISEARLKEKPEIGICQRRQLTATCGPFVTSWTGSKPFADETQSVSPAVTIGILRWFTVHVRTGHMHKAPAKLPYAARNSSGRSPKFILPQGETWGLRDTYTGRKKRNTFVALGDAGNVFISPPKNLFSFRAARHLSESYIFSPSE